MASSAGRTVKQIQDEQASAKSEKRDSEKAASMRLYGFTDAEAFNAITRCAITASNVPVDDQLDHAPSGVWYRAYDLASSLDPEQGQEKVEDALRDAESPREFWQKLGESLGGDMPEPEPVAEEDA